MGFIGVRFSLKFAVFAKHFCSVMLAVLLFPLTSRSQSAVTPTVQPTLLNCSPDSSPNWKKQLDIIVQSTCVAECEAAKCKEFFGSAEFSCVNHCQNQHTTPLNLLRSCGAGVLNNVGGMITFPWDAFKLTIDTSTALAEKQKDPDIVRRLAFEAGFLTKISKKDLNDYTDAEKKSADALLSDIEIGDLLRKRENLRSVATRDPKYEKYLRENHIPLPNIDSKTTPAEDVIASVSSLLKNKGVRWTCLNDAGRAEMFCDALVTLATAAQGFKSLARLGELKAATLAEEAGTTSKVASAESINKSSIKPPSAEVVLNRKLDPETRQAIHESHEVGHGETGRDGTDAKVGNFTDAQLRRKSQKLKDAGINRADRRKLVENKVVGYDPEQVQPGSVVAVPHPDGGIVNAKVLKRGKDAAGKDTIDIEVTELNGEKKLEHGIPITHTSEKLVSGNGHLKANDTVFIEVKDAGLAQGKLVKFDGTNAVVSFQRKNASGAMETFETKVAASDLRTVGSPVSVKKVTGDYNPGHILKEADASGKVQVEVADPRGSFKRAIDPADLKPRTVVDAPPAPDVAAPVAAPVAFHVPEVIAPAPPAPRTTAPIKTFNEVGTKESVTHLQEAGFRAFAKGDKAAAKKIDQELVQHLSTDKIVFKEPIAQGSSDVYKVRFASGLEGVYKPHLKYWDKKRRILPFHDAKMPERDAAAFITDRNVEAHMIPATVVRSVGGETGSIQVFVHADPHTPAVPGSHESTRMMILDYINATHDRTPKNVLKVEGQPIAIDNSMSHLVKSPHYSHGIQTPPTLEKLTSQPDFASELKSFDLSKTSELKTELTPYLDAQEIDQVVQKIETLRSIQNSH